MFAIVSCVFYSATAGVAARGHLWNAGEGGHIRSKVATYYLMCSMLGKLATTWAPAFFAEIQVFWVPTPRPRPKDYTVQDQDQ